LIWSSILEPRWPSFWDRIGQEGHTLPGKNYIYTYIRPQTNLTFQKPTVHDCTLTQSWAEGMKLARSTKVPSAFITHRCYARAPSWGLSNWNYTSRDLATLFVFNPGMIMNLSVNCGNKRGGGTTKKAHLTWKAYSSLELNSWSSPAQVHQKCYMRTTTSSVKNAQSTAQFLFYDWE
jgi:hypothetical protein